MEGKDELTQTYKSYDDYLFTNNETRHPRYKNAAYSVLFTLTNDEFQLPNWKCVLQKCTACTSIDLSGVERDSSNQAPIIMFNKYVTQFTCSNHGILIHKRKTTYLDAKGTYKRTCFLCEQLIRYKTPDFTCGRTYERVKLFFVNTRLVIFTKIFIFNKLKILPTTAVTTKYLENIILLTLCKNHLNLNQATSVLGQIMPNELDLNPTVNCRMNYLTTIIPYLWKGTF